MNQQADAEAKLRKLARVEELGAAVDARWKKYGRLDPLAVSLRELLDELKKPAGRATHNKGAAPRPAPAKTTPARRRS